MKKGIALLLGLVLILSLAACGKSEKTSGSAASVFGDIMGNDKPSPEEIWVCVSEELKQNEDSAPSDVGEIVFYNYDYNEHGDRIRSETKTSPDFEPSIEETAFEYDRQDNIIRKTSTGGKSVSYEYDEKGNCTREVSSSGAYTTIEYEYAGDRIVKKIRTQWSPDYVSNPSRVERYSYDPDGHVLTEVFEDYSGTGSYSTRENTYTLNSEGKVEKFDRHIWHTRYDGTTEDDRWYIGTYTYDARGDVLQYRLDRTDEQNMEIIDYENDYDENDNCIYKVERYHKESEDSFSYTETKFEYDATGSMIKKQYKEVVDVSVGSVLWYVREYDAYGNAVLSYYLNEDTNARIVILKSTYMRLSDYLAGKTE